MSHGQLTKFSPLNKPLTGDMIRGALIIGLRPANAHLALENWSIMFKRFLKWGTHAVTGYTYFRPTQTKWPSRARRLLRLRAKQVL